MARKQTLQFATTSQQDLRRVAGSERAPLPNARIIGPADPEQPIKLTVYVRSRPAHTHIPSLKEIGHSPYEWMHSTQSAQSLSAFEADPKDIAAVKKFAAANKLKVLEDSTVKRSVLIEGKTGDAARAFGVDLQIWEHPGGRYRGRVGPVHTPDSLRGIVEAVFGFDNRVMGRPYFRRSRHRFVSRAAQPLNYLPPEVADFYSFPDADGSGQTIAIFAFNGALGDSGQTALGGYTPKLLKSYFQGYASHHAAKDHRRRRPRSGQQARRRQPGHRRNRRGAAGHLHGRRFAEGQVHDVLHRVHRAGLG